MTLPLDTTGDRASVAAMSTLMLGVGYVVSGLAPIGLGAVRDATGSFELPLALLAADALLLLMVAIGSAQCHPGLQGSARDRWAG
jgi:CP family cyanate transporter-like MFS transporter